MNTLDWKKLEAFVAERNPVEVSAGILNDWFWTAATVYENGEWKDRDRPHVTSFWATPGFKAEMPNGDLIEVEASIEETPEQAEQRKIKSAENSKKLRELAETLRTEIIREPRASIQSEARGTSKQVGGFRNIAEESVD